MLTSFRVWVAHEIDLEKMGACEVWRSLDRLDTLLGGIKLSTW